MSKSIFDRLTDPKLYTGAHKNRFDAEGKGKGIAGRYDVVDFKGSTNTAVVDKAVTGANVTSKKPVVSGQLGGQKFGTQAKKAAVVKLFRNGDKHHSGETFTVNMKTITSMTQVYEKVSSLVRLPTGAVRKIWKANLKGTIKEVGEFEDGQMYICTGAEPVDLTRLPAAFATIAG